MPESQSFFSAVWESFYSSRLYRSVQLWRGTALAYLGVVLFFCWLPVCIKFQILIRRGLDQAVAAAAAQMPVIRFEYGHIRTPENKPYALSFGQGLKKVDVLIDTSGKYVSLDGQAATILLTRDKMFTRQKNGEVRIYDLSKSMRRPVTIDQPFIRKMALILRRWVFPVLYILMFILSYLKRLVQAFLMALVGLGLASACDVDLDLGELLSLAIVAMTPAMILETLVSLTGKQIPKLWLLWMLMIAGYFIFAVNAASDKTLPPDSPDSP